MNKIMKITSIIFVLNMVSCVTNITHENIEKKSDIEVCRIHGDTIYSKTKELAKQELISRNLVTDKELQSISNKKIFVGMSECALFASWGSPRKQNRTILSRSIRTQNIYGGVVKYNPTSYAYTENGKVTAIQTNNN